jgi:hypothetical protein
MTPHEIEEFVRCRLAEMYGTNFKRAKLVVGHDSGRRPQIHEFDLVSENAKIVGEIKSGRCSRTNYNLALVDCVYLGKIRARTKLMIFTNKRLCEYFKQNSAGVVSKYIQTIFVDVETQMKIASTC